MKRKGRTAGKPSNALKSAIRGLLDPFKHYHEAMNPGEFLLDLWWMGGVAGLILWSILYGWGAAA